MPTALDIIRRSMRIINVLASGETPNAQEQQDGLISLNAMLDSWQVDKLNIYALQEDTHTLVSGTSAYTIGSGGTIDTTRPEEIQRAFVREGTTDYPLHIVDDKGYSELQDKSVSGVPEWLWYNATNPLGTITLYPTPGSGYVLHIYQWLHLQSFANLTTSLTMPSGYEDAIVYSLAERLAPEYGVQLSLTAQKLAAETKAAVKRKNIKPIYSGVEASLIPRGRGDFNVIRGY